MSMPSRARHRRGHVAAVGTSALALVAAAALGGATPAAASPAPAAAAASKPEHRTRASVPAGTTSAGSFRLGTQRSAGEKVDRSLAGAKGAVDVMIELDARSATSAYLSARPRGIAAAKGAARAQTLTVRRAQRGVEAAFGRSATRARTLYRSHALYSGVAVRTDASRLRALAALPGVKAVHRIVPKQPSNSSSVPLIGAPQVWHANGQTGQGVRIGIIDTGIDYTHADFGGPGTTAAFDAAKATNTFTPTAKVVGGYDFAGDAYNPSEGVDTPVPDDNPLDCEGHGSHVAGTTAGLGVGKDGQTWAGGYDKDIAPSDVSIGPGVAPGAKLYALKVFGCDGDTNLVGQALEWAADPNGDGDVSDHLDVVNMSLGSSYGSPDDPDAVASNALAALGTVVVASMGNSGDVYEVGGAPGNATRVLAVAASDDGNDVVDGLKVDSPTGIEPADTVDGTQDDVFAALKSTSYDWVKGPGVTDTAVVTLGDWSKPETDTNNSDACTALSSADAAKVAGKVVLTKWYDGTGRRCGSGGRSQNLLDAGAAGVIFGSDVNSFSAGVLGAKGIPAMLTVNQATKAIKAALDASTPVTVTMTNALRNAVTVVDKGAVDQLAGFSSRGIGVAGTVKPDVAAPGVTTFSVAVGTGNEGIAESGTSMASPHVAGEAALVRASHPTWSVEEVKAAIMNTATQDVYVGPNHTGASYGPERVGSGRVQVAGAVDTTTLAYVEDTPGAVGVSFGPVAVTAPTTTLRKTVRVENKASTGTAAYTIAYQPTHPTPGVTYTFSPTQVSVPAGGSADVTVTATITRSQLRAVPDPTTSSDPLGLGIKRSYRADASGRMVLTPVGDTTPGALRVPVWSAPRPASTMSAAGTAVVSGPTGLKSGSLRLTGTGVGDETAVSSTDYLSSVSTFQLQGSSAKLPACSTGLPPGCVALPDDRSADLRYVGSASDLPAYPDATSAMANGLVSFGISSWGPWRTPASYTEFDVWIDANGDGKPDAVTYNTRVTTTDDYDYFIAETVDIRNADPSKWELVDQELLNGWDGSFDTNVFNSDSLALPVSVAALQDAGLVSGPSARLRYWVESSTAEAGAVPVDSVGSSSAPMTLSIGSPALAAYGDYLTLASTDLPGGVLHVRRDQATIASDKPAGLLLVHHTNTDGNRAQVVGVKVASATRLYASTTSYTYGGKPTYTATLFPATSTGTVTFRDNGRAVRTVTVTSGKAVYTASGQTRGTHSMTATYNGDAVTVGSSSGTVKVTVKGLASHATLKASYTRYAYGYRPPLMTATVTPSWATGTVTFKDGSRVLWTGAVRSGKTVYRLPKLARGTHRVTAVYNGSYKYAPATSTAVTITVR